MAVEIEKKFLIISNNWRDDASEGVQFLQGYFATNDSCSIRVRIAGNKANLNIKSATLGVTRTEYEYSISMKDAEQMLQNLCIQPLIEKTRYHVKHDEHTWEVDVFAGKNEGLVVAEIELKSTNEAFTKPNWIGDEVSDDPRYYNVSLVSYPYKNWTK